MKTQKINVTKKRFHDQIIPVSLSYKKRGKKIVILKLHMKICKWVKSYVKILKCQYFGVVIIYFVKVEETFKRVLEGR